jgi:hypothetical protein
MRTIQISTAKSKKKYKANVKHFKTIQLASFRDLAIKTTTDTWSPCHWRGGARLSENYLGCSLAVWDFDDGTPTLKEMTEHCMATGLAFFIATTRSHLVAKPGHPMGDRYRLVMPCARDYSTDPEIFAKQMILTLKIYGRKPDRSCHDAARYYFPSSVVTAGRWTERLFVPPAEEAAQKLIDSEKRYISNVETRIKFGGLPRRVQQFLDDGTTWNGRAIACFAAGANLALKPLSEKQIIDIVMAAPIVRTGERPSDTITDKEIIRNVRNGIKQSRKKTSL